MTKLKELKKFLKKKVKITEEWNDVEEKEAT